ncbi:MAG: hypothetical protein HY319_16315 [Armatimonadetes bacterium]|nr:hypothetical protein [Armatimonadota bacterium]
MRHLLAILLLAVLCAQAGAEERYLDREAGFSLAPLNWQGARIGQGNTALRLKSPDGSCVYTVMVMPNEAGMDVPQVGEALFQQAAASGYKMVGSRQVKVGAHAGGQVTYRTADGKVEQTTGVPLGGRIYFLQVASRSGESFKKNRPQFDRITSSFQPELTPQGQRSAEDRAYYERRERLRRERLRDERLRQERLDRERYQ